MTTKPEWDNEEFWAKQKAEAQARKDLAAAQAKEFWAKQAAKKAATPEQKRAVAKRLAGEFFK